MSLVKDFSVLDSTGSGTGLWVEKVLQTFIEGVQAHYLGARAAPAPHIRPTLVRPPGLPAGTRESAPLRRHWEKVRPRPVRGIGARPRELDHSCNILPTETMSTREDARKGCGTGGECRSRKLGNHLQQSEDSTSRSPRRRCDRRSYQTDRT